MQDRQHNFCFPPKNYFQRNPIDWRELKKELVDLFPSKNISKTYQHEDIFNTKSSKLSIDPDRTVNKRCFGKFQNERKERITNNSKSSLFNENGPINTEPTVKTKKPLQTHNQIEKKFTSTRINPKDHDDRYFFEKSKDSDNEKAGLKGVQKKAWPFEHPSYNKLPIQRKLEELYDTEYEREVLEINKKPVSFTQRSKSEFEIKREEVVSARQQRIQDQQSNLFGGEKNMYNCQPSNRKQKTEVQIKPHNTSKHEYSYSQNLNQWNVKEIDNIKQQNHNFSDVFGLEYGARGNISKEKSNQRQLSTLLSWNKTDTVRHQKDIGNGTLNNGCGGMLKKKHSVRHYQQNDCYQMDWNIQKPGVRKTPSFLGGDQ